MTTAFDKDLELIFQKLTSDRQVKQALDFLKQDAPNTIAQQKELVVIEAPTFQEKQRSLHYAQMLKAAGLQDVTCLLYTSAGTRDFPAGCRRRKCPLAETRRCKSYFQ